MSSTDAADASPLPEGEPEDARRTSYLELFFDLVFVFAITQVASLILDDTSAAGFARSLLVLGMVWWAWSAYAWTTTTLDLEARVGRLGLMVAMAASFFMAIAVPEAYGDQGAWFAAAYFTLRVLQGLLSLHGVRDEPELLHSWAALAPFFLIAPSLVLVGGLVESDGARIGLWVAAIAVDVAGALNAGRHVYRISPSHFAERHGLIVIIALGESIVAIGLGALEADRDLLLAAAVLVAFLGTATLWWSYFDFVATALERALVHTDPRVRGRIARDVFTFLHFPMVAGIVFFAVAAKKAVAHPADPLSHAGRFALGAGIAMFLLGFLGGRFRLIRKLAGERVAAAIGVVVLAAVGDDLDAAALIALAVGIVALALVIEAIRLREPRARLRAR